MRVSLMLAGLSIVLLSTAALAQIDPDPDGIGFYFDTEGSQVCGTAETGTTVFIYLAITRASAAGGVYGWDARIELAPDPLPEGHFVLAWTLLGDGPLTIPMYPDYIVGLGTPTPWSPSIELMEIQLLIAGVPACVQMFLRPVGNPSHPGKMVYVDGSDLTNVIDLHYSAGEYGQPCLMLNCPDCDPQIIASEPSSWGRVKAMYR
jgi:hypothetical protein